MAAGGSMSDELVGALKCVSYFTTGMNTGLLDFPLKLNIHISKIVRN